MEEIDFEELVSFYKGKEEDPQGGGSGEYREKGLDGESSIALHSLEMSSGLSESVKEESEMEKTKIRKRVNRTHHGVIVEEEGVLVARVSLKKKKKKKKRKIGARVGGSDAAAVTGLENGEEFFGGHMSSDLKKEASEVETWAAEHLEKKAKGAWMERKWRKCGIELKGNKTPLKIQKGREKKVEKRDAKILETARESGHLPQQLSKLNPRFRNSLLESIGVSRKHIDGKKKPSDRKRVHGIKGVAGTFRGGVLHIQDPSTMQRKRKTEGKRKR
eukprot:TRINITY_DN269_c0_g1_i1.p1 TRINITY_DN269_c0_g1~~TRINITY_DN269_c0_g1_i1.p1  ORF type:complete len:295 (-),score=111.00 TRINITY_DN269_c0_g1_i1:225-1046(-)